MSDLRELLDTETAAREYVRRLGVTQLYEVRRLNLRWHQLWDWLSRTGWSEQQVREAAVLFRLSEGDVVDILTDLRRMD